MSNGLERFVTAQQSYYAIDKFFHGERDQRTIEILRKEEESRFETKS
jgi:hypothetical protein